MKYTALSLATALALSVTAFGQGTNDADNSGKNARDSSGETLTPIDQSNDPDDLKLAAEIRKMLVDDPSLSTVAKNVKVITIDEVVTLRGPVETKTEKATIEKHAKMAGAKSVTNQIEIKTN